MPTTNRFFWPAYVDGDGTFGTDVRKAQITNPGDGTASVADFGSSPGAGALITIDPFDTRSATGVSDAFGWQINLNGATDGMESTATAKRIIPAGQWAYNGSWQSNQAAGLDATLTARVYRVSAAGARTALFSMGVRNTLLAALRTALFMQSGAQPQFTIEAGETIMVAFEVTYHGGGLLQRTVSFFLGGTGDTDAALQLPNPGLRTLYPRSHTTAVSLAGTSQRRTAPTAKVGALALAATAVRSAVANRSFTTAITLAGTVRKFVLPAPKVGALSLTGVPGVRTIALAAKVGALSLTGVLGRRTVAPAPKVGALTLTGTATRRSTAARASTTAITLGSGFARAVVNARAFSTTISLAATASRRLLASRAFTTAHSLVATARKGVVTGPKVAVLSLVATMTRRVTSVRAFTTAITLNTAFARAVTTVRGFSTSIALTARGRVDMAFTVLNRITGGGGTTIIKRIIQIFDD